MSKKTLGLAAAVGVLVCVLFFFLVRGGFGGAAPVAKEGEAVPMLIEGVLDDGGLVVYDIQGKGNKSISITEKTTLRDEQGMEMAYTAMKPGDLAMIRLDSDGETALEVDYSGKINRREMTGLTADTEKRILSGEDDSFAYNKESMFLYNEEEISPKDLEACDVLLVQGVGETVWSVEVLEYHGYIVIKHNENIKNGKFRLDEDEEMPLEEVERIPVREGTHTVTVSGDNIETRTDNIFVGTGEEYTYDLSKAQEKVGVLIINANVSDYKLYLNGTLVDSTTPSVLPLGEYDIVILKNGYLEWNQHVTLAQDTLTVKAELQKEFQYGTLSVTADCDGALVYIDGEEMGIAPMEVNLPYGSYTIRLEKKGYDTFEQVVSINGLSASLHAEME